MGGRYSISGEAQTSVSVCKACIGGRYSSLVPARTSIGVCIACIAGRYSTAGEAQTSITVCDNKCSSGKWSDKVGLASLGKWLPHTNVEHLDMTANHLTPLTVSILMNGLALFPTLQSVKLDENPIGLLGTAAVLRSL